MPIAVRHQHKADMSSLGSIVEERIPKSYLDHQISGSMSDKSDSGGEAASEHMIVIFVSICSKKNSISYSLSLMLESDYILSRILL